MTKTWPNERIINFINELWTVVTRIYKDRNPKKDGWAVSAKKFGMSRDEAYKKMKY